MKKLLAISSTALIASVALMSPLTTSSAQAEVRAGKSITVFHNLDFVAATGYPEGQEMTVEVWREGINIGSATSPAVQTPEGPGLEVNHGTEAAVPGDCWDDITPDILPGDEVRVIGDGGTDSIIVANVNFDDGFPVEIDDDPVTGNIGQFPGAQDGDVILEGTAFNEDGSPMDTAQLAGEFRIQPNPRYRAEPNLIQDLDGEAGGAWRSIYRAPYADVDNDDNLNDSQKKAALLNPAAEHSMVFAPNVRETHIADNGAAGGPAPGCEGSPRSANAVTTFDDEAVNLSSDTLVANGTALDGTESVSVSLDDEDSATPAITKDASLSPSGTAWTVTFTRAELESLTDGTLTATGTYTGPNVPSTGAPKTIEKDTVAPAAPTAFPLPGSYNSSQAVTLNESEVDPAKIFYTVGDGTQPDPDANSTLFNGQISVTSSQTIKALVIDGAGNPSPIASFGYVIEATAPGVTNLKPTPNSTTKNRRVAIGATITDGQTELASTNIQLFFDGSPLAFNYDQATDILSARSPRLSPGRHTVRVVATDEALNSTTQQWKFKVVKKRR